jgi:hypothetical protein
MRCQRVDQAGIPHSTSHALPANGSRHSRSPAPDALPAQELPAASECALMVIIGGVAANNHHQHTANTLHLSRFDIRNNIYTIR